MRKSFFFILVCGQVIATFTALAQKPGGIQVRPLKRETIRPIALIPPTPANFAADGYSLIETEVTWQNNATNAEGFEIEENITGSGISQSRRLPANSTSASYMYAGSGVKACYRIRAYNKNGYSVWSNQVCATTGVYKSPPPAPTGLKAEKVSGTQINLTWYTETMLRRIEGFVVEYKMVATGAQFAKRETIRVAAIKSSGEITVKCGSSEMCDAKSFNGINTYPVRYSSPQPFGVTYCFRVMAFNNAGNSQYTNEACKTND